MKLINREAFLKMPAGTIFCKGQPWHFDGPKVKGDSLPNDYFFMSLDWIESDGINDGQLFNDMLANGTSQPMNECEARDGCFDNDDLFLVYEQSDLVELKNIIDEAMNKYNVNKNLPIFQPDTITVDGQEYLVPCSAALELREIHAESKAAMKEERMKELRDWEDQTIYAIGEGVPPEYLKEALDEIERLQGILDLHHIEHE